MLLVQYEMPSASSSIWTRVTVTIFPADSDYTTGTFCVYVHNIKRIAK